MGFDRAVFFQQSKAAGLLCVATDDDGDFDVDYLRPGEPRLNGSGWTDEHAIEYQDADRPGLTEGDELSIVDADGNDLGTFRVRQDPHVDAPGNAADGFFRFAVLTKT